MTKKTILCGALVAMCGCGNKGAVTTSGPGASAPLGVADTAPAQAPSPEIAFRKRYSNPGGMWMPAQMTLPQHVDNFKKMGVALSAQQLSDPLGEPLAAIVWLGACTGAFVSPDGLIVTNHHCVQTASQINSTPENNILENGFVAKTWKDEKPAGPAQHVMVVQAYRDVTKEMRDGLDKIKDPVARKEQSEKRMNQLVHDCEKERPELRCQVSSFFGGGMYQLYEMLEIRDVRLVYTPARSVGNYGGEIDNWKWPRHAGEWSFFRAYVGKDGKPADPSPDSVPYKPKHWLHVSTEGLEAGDFVMEMGYQRTTNRLQTAAELHHDLEWYYPYLLEYLQQRYEFAKSLAGAKGETAVKATLMQELTQDELEKRRGILQGFQRNPRLLAQKDALDKRLKDWAAQPGHETEKVAIDKVDEILADKFRTARADFDRGVAFGVSRLLSTALWLTRWADERANKDADRMPGFQQRDLPRAIGRMKQFAQQYDRMLDRGAFRLSLLRALKLPEADRGWLATLLGANKGQQIDEAFIDKTLDAWYATQTIETDAVRLELLQKGTMAKLERSKDPFIKAALRVFPIIEAEEKKANARIGELMLVMPTYVDALKTVLGGALAPDANATLRITYGTVKSLNPQSRDAADWPFTVASQILAKNTGREPFDAPQKVLDAIAAKKFGPYADPALDGDLPVNFESDLDVVGAPTLNDKGELVGLAFDGNEEGLASDAVFDSSTTRTIHVDVRYMIWMMDALDGADHLIREMGLRPQL